MLVTDEAETLIGKVGYDLLKSIISNGAYDADVKYKSDTSHPDGAGLQLFAVGNSLFDQVQVIDKAFVERIAWFKFDKLVQDCNRDPLLTHKLSKERGTHHIYNALLFLDCLRQPEKATKFWFNVASPNLRLNRELAKLEGDLAAQLVKNYSAFYRVVEDPVAPPLYVEDFQAALSNYYVERKMDPKKMPRNFLDSIKRLPYMSVKKEDVCSRCGAFAPNRQTCGVHYRKDLISKRDVIYGLRLEHFPLGVHLAPAPNVTDAVVDASLGDVVGEEESKDLVVETKFDESILVPAATQVPASDCILKEYMDLFSSDPTKLQQLQAIAHLPLPYEEKVCKRTFRRRQAKELFPELSPLTGPEIDKLMSWSATTFVGDREFQLVSIPVKRAQRQSYAPASVGDSYCPKPM